MSLTFDPRMRLPEADEKALGQRVPLPLHERLEEMCDLVYEARNPRPTKVRMLAALILASPTDPESLELMLRRYDAATVVDALLSPRRTKADLIELPKRKSGPHGPRAGRRG